MPPRRPPCTILARARAAVVAAHPVRTLSPAETQAALALLCQQEAARPKPPPHLETAPMPRPHVLHNKHLRAAECAADAIQSRGLRPKDLAARTHLSQAQVVQTLNRPNVMSQTWHRIARALGTTPMGLATEGGCDAARASAWAADLRDLATDSPRPPHAAALAMFAEVDATGEADAGSIHPPEPTPCAPPSPTSAAATSAPSAAPSSSRERSEVEASSSPTTGASSPSPLPTATPQPGASPSSPPPLAAPPMPPPATTPSASPTSTPPKYRAEHDPVHGWMIERIPPEPHPLDAPALKLGRAVLSALSDAIQDALSAATARAERAEAEAAAAHRRLDVLAADLDDARRDLAAAVSVISALRKSLLSA